MSPVPDDFPELPPVEDMPELPPDPVDSIRARQITLVVIVFGVFVSGMSTAAAPEWLVLLNGAILGCVMVILWRWLGSMQKWWAADREIRIAFVMIETFRGIRNAIEAEDRKAEDA